MYSVFSTKISHTNLYQIITGLKSIFVKMSITIKVLNLKLCRLA